MMSIRTSPAPSSSDTPPSPNRTTSSASSLSDHDADAALQPTAAAALIPSLPAAFVPSPPTVGFASSSPSMGGAAELFPHCALCRDVYRSPRLLSCLHSFCLGCLEAACISPDRVECHICKRETYLSTGGVASLPTDDTAKYPINGGVRMCGACGGGAAAVARCYGCSPGGGGAYLCSGCAVVHLRAPQFNSHQVVQYSEPPRRVDPDVNCRRHRAEKLVFYCRTCSVPICVACTQLDHNPNSHAFCLLSAVAVDEIQSMVLLAHEASRRATELRAACRNVELSESFLKQQHSAARSAISETFNFFSATLEDRQQSLLRELDVAFSDKQVKLSSTAHAMLELSARVSGACTYMQKLVTRSSQEEVLLCKAMLEAKLRSSLDYVPEVSGDCPNAYDLEFISSHQNIQAAVRNSFGIIRQGRNGPTSAPTPGQYGTGYGHQSRVNQEQLIETLLAAAAAAASNGSSSSGRSSSLSVHDLATQAALLHRAANNPPYGGPGSSHVDPSLNGGFRRSSNPGEIEFGKWDNSILTGASSYGGGASSFGGGAYGSGGGAYGSGGGANEEEGDIFSNADMFSLGGESGGGNRDKGNGGGASEPARSQLPRVKMSYDHKFGEFGSANGQFTEPSGVAVNALGDILVADTNNHRIQVFDRTGEFKFVFGQCGKRDGQLLYPNRVAVCRQTGNIVVTERSPTHQVQIFTHDGRFVRKFGSTKLQHPRGVCVDNQRRIIIVECKVMRVIIFDQQGTELSKFGCSKHLEFPNGVIVNDREEIFISDNRSHCVKVFSYAGVYLRQIGGEGITNYPIGVGINAAGEILIADNHNNFNVTAFKQTGDLAAALESRVKHAQCYDVALGPDGTIVVASRDFRIYVYRYGGGAGEEGGAGLASPGYLGLTGGGVVGGGVVGGQTFHGFFDAKCNI